MAKVIALVEDEQSIRDNYAQWLRRHGYEVQEYASKKEASEGFARQLPDLAVLDIGLGDEAEGGFDLCRELRGKSVTLPIIFLSALDSDFDMISGLRLGADDYLTKDVSLPFLQARINALFRRLEALSQPENKEAKIRRGDLVLDSDRFTAHWQGIDLALTLTEFWMLHALILRPGHVKQREQLLRDANVIVEENTITSHVKRMRRKFEAITAGFDYIETVYGVGYRWSGPVN
ncbi:MAG TPA: proteobacterial dedicated sortase system response regulator [Aeromonadales bacterium]|nr:proteobacterial dedicated sortase system response regulator [Aeromonadales bacterium]